MKIALLHLNKLTDLLIDQPIVQALVRLSLVPMYIIIDIVFKASCSVGNIEYIALGASEKPPFLTIWATEARPRSRFAMTFRRVWVARVVSFVLLCIVASASKGFTSEDICSDICVSALYRSRPVIF